MNREQTQGSRVLKGLGYSCAERCPTDHGVNCVKVIHNSSGFLHGEDDDRPYDVDGVVYCGRCHEFIA